MTDTPRDEVIAAQIHAPIEVLLQQNATEWTLVMRRQFPHPPEKMWRMITDPELLVLWSPVVPDRTLDSPGPATCRENPGDDPLDAEVLVADPPRELTHRWSTDILTWTITPTEHGSILELRQSLTTPAQAGMTAAGWHICLGRLAAEQGDIPRERVVGARALAYDWDQLNDHYKNLRAAGAS